MRSSLRLRLAPSACAALLSLLLVALASSSVHARSGGLLSSCDLTPQIYPNPGQAHSQLWPNGRFGANYSSTRLPYLDSGVAMRWVKAPVPSNFYTIRSGDGSDRSTDAVTYTPGGTLTEIHLRVFDLQRRYIGLVLYATNSSVGTRLPLKESQVGNWTVLPDTLFQVAPTPGCPNAVTHTGANLKPLHTRFWWSAPVGTGTVRFRVLIKQGEQAKGNFFYPIQELVLREGPPPPEVLLPVNGTRSSVLQNATLVGFPGRACADVCWLQTPATPFCDAPSMLAIRSVEALRRTMDGHLPCKLPLLAGCPYVGGAQIDSGYCSFKSNDVATTCPGAYRAFNATNAMPVPDVCYTAPAPDVSNVCICSSSNLVQPPNPFFAAAVARGEVPSTGSSKTGSAGRSAATGLWAILAAGALCMNTKRPALLLLVVVCMMSLLVATPVRAHNYIKSQHRAWEAAVSNPCQARVGNDPHVQVVADQTYEIEWSNGHSDQRTSWVWFVTLPLAEINQLMADNITAIIQDYVNLAPLSSYANMSSNPAYWEKHHLHRTSECTGIDASKTCNSNAYFKEDVLPTTDPSFIWREPAYMSKAHPNQYKSETATNKIIQQRLHDVHNAKDRRVSYASGKYPWIESVDTFEIPYAEHDAYANQADIARFKVPARHGPGEYLVWFYWQGYKDCVDVHVLPGTTPVANRYGLNLTSTTPINVIKTDHCEFTNAANADTMLRRLGPTKDVAQCIADCKRRPNSCNSVQVVRAINPPRALSYPENIPWIPYSFNNTAEALFGLTYARSLPCAQLSYANRLAAGCRNPPTTNANPSNPAYAGLTEDDMFCYGLKPLRNQDNQVEEDYTIATEPEDPVFYSTCYTFVPAGGFLQIPAYEVNKLGSARELRAELTGADMAFAGVGADGQPLSSGEYGSGSSASKGGLLSSRLGLIIGLGILLVVALSVGVGGYACVRHHRAKAEASKAMTNIATVGAGAELTANPAARW